MVPTLFRVTMSLPSIPRLLRLTAMAVLFVVTVHLVSLALSDPTPRPGSPASVPAHWPSPSILYAVQRSESKESASVASSAVNPDSESHSYVDGGASQSQSLCVVLDSSSPCATGQTWSRGVMLPNLYGHYTIRDASDQLEAVLRTVTLSSSPSSEIIAQFMCTLYLPPCPIPGERVLVGVGEPLPLPCRPLCELARAEVERAGSGKGAGDGWPSSIRCHVFPTERCYSLAGPGEVKYVKKSLLASGTGARMHDVIPQYVATLDSELGDDDPYDVQVMTLGTNQIPPRRYDLTDLGDPMYFQGWADVQGTGAANDYCRVIGKGKRRFLACALAGTRGQGHQYVSKLGFDSGHNATWFMRDVDNDGRDDYCRCVGETSVSRVVCMKAGEKGFYGSTVQGGSENTFELPGSNGCHYRRLNPHFGV